MMDCHFIRPMTMALMGAALAFAACPRPSAGQVDPLRPAFGWQPGADPNMQPAHFRWRVGAIVTGGTTRSQDILIVIPVPTDWPEQRVVLVDQQVSPQFQNYSFRTIAPGATQVVARTPLLNPNQRLELILTFSIEVDPIAAPSETDSLKVPTRITKELKPFLENTREITYRNSKLTDLVREIVDREQPAWNQVRALYDWVRENIESIDQSPQDTIDCFLKRAGAPEDIVGLFVAMCRSIKVPARMVWVEGSQYAEFYLVDGQDEGRWYPAHVIGLADLGSLPEPRVILQKGDSIKVPEKELPLRYVPEIGRAKGTTPMSMNFIRELLPGQ